MTYPGATLSVDAQGELVVTTASYTLVQSAPVAYQTVNGQEVTVRANYQLSGNTVTGFTLVGYNPNLALTIDPAFVSATYLGGSLTDQTTGTGAILGIGNPAGPTLAVDSAGQAYVAGVSDSLNYPVVGTLGAVSHGLDDIVVTKLNATGTALIWSAYVGGSLNDQALAIAVDSAANVYLTGETGSVDFPTTPGAIQASPGAASSNQDAFVVRINAFATALTYASYLGGSQRARSAAPSPWTPRSTCTSSAPPVRRTSR